MNYPIIAIYAEDWAGPSDADEHYDVEEIEKEITPIKGWISGILVAETSNHVVICRDYFPETNLCRCPVSITKYSIKQRIDYEIPKNNAVENGCQTG